MRIITGYLYNMKIFSPKEKINKNGEPSKATMVFSLREVTGKDRSVFWRCKQFIENGEKKDIANAELGNQKGLPVAVEGRFEESEYKGKTENVFVVFKIYTLLDLEGSRPERKAEQPEDDEPPF